MSIQASSLSTGIQALPYIEISRASLDSKNPIQDAIDFIGLLKRYGEERTELYPERELPKASHLSKISDHHPDLSSDLKILANKYLGNKKFAQIFEKLSVKFDPELSNYHELVTKLILSCFSNLDHIPLLEKPVKYKQTPESIESEVTYHKPTHLVMRVKIINMETDVLRDAIMVTTKKTINIYSIQSPAPFLININNWRISESPLIDKKGYLWSLPSWCLGSPITHSCGLYTLENLFTTLQKTERFVKAQKSDKIVTLADALTQFLSKDTSGVVISYLIDDAIIPSASNFPN